MGAITHGITESIGEAWDMKVSLFGSPASCPCQLLQQNGVSMKKIPGKVLVVSLMFLVFLPANALAVEQFVFSSYKDIDDLFEKLGYTREAWQQGIREVPPLYLQNIPIQWRDKSSKEISIQHKKRIFFRILGPLVLHANENILAERSSLEKMIGKKKLSIDDEARLLELAQKYRVVKKEATNVGREQMAELLKRVDIVPPSIALAQGANESGWGTSRFSEAGNALFGQWTWGGWVSPPRGNRRARGITRWRLSTRHSIRCSPIC